VTCRRVRVAVTGVGVVSPVGVGAPAFWDALLAGRSGIAPITAFDASRLPVRIAGEVREFDAAAWVGAKAARRLDRFCHFGLAAADMAIGDARFAPGDPERVGTVFSSGFGGARMIERAALKYRDAGPQAVPALFVPASIVNMAAGQIAERHGFGGPNTCPVTACASSADAVGWGFRLVRDGYADACLVGGAEACVEGAIIAGFANIGALSTRNDDPAAASRPFDADRDGFVMGEGAAALMLEPLDEARARGARVYAELCGYGQSCDAYHATAPQPDGAGVARAIRAALHEAAIAPESVDYVNAHGTSTPLLDPIETRALKRGLGDAAAGVAVSSTKSMTGHLLGAAGALEAVACALAVHTGRMPPTINLATPDPQCDLDYVPNVSRAAVVDVALSNSMGFGGHNVSLVMRRP
jgi:3-oxoacyl-[acyl-carrier-protein] synthase II